MPNRIFSQNETKQTKSQPFGLVAWLEQTKVTLPLKGVECRFRVCGDLLNVEVDQIFHQNSAQPMDCLYTFPLPVGAAVYCCEMHVNGRLIRAKVEEQERAREMVVEQRAAGRRTVLVEVERDNLFTLSLGNVQPGDVVVIRFAYFQTLTRLADWTSLRIPFCPGVRYIPGQPLLRALRGRGTADDTDEVPDASRLSPPRLDALHPDAAYLSVEGTVEDPGGVVTEISSSSHPVLVRDRERVFQIGLAEQTAVPDCDFSLRWTEKNCDTVQPVGWALEEGADTYALVRLRAPRLVETTSDEGQDFYFLVDRSGSMEGLKWQKALKAFRSFLQLLGPRDRAWLTLFDDVHADFAERPLTAAEWNQDGGLTRLDEIRARGGTELLPALRHVLEAVARHSTNRRVALMLITDGQVGNEADIIAALAPHSNLRVHTFGIDSAVNDALLVRVAERQRGSCCLLLPTDDIAGAVTRLGAQLRRPVLTELSVEGGWEWPGDAPADLHSEEVAMLALKGKAGATEVMLHGRGIDGVTRTFLVKLDSRREPALRLLWARRAIDHRLQNGRRPEAIALATRFNLLCEGTAFVAWDEAEKGPVSTREIYQPCLEATMFASLLAEKVGFVGLPAKKLMAEGYVARGGGGEDMFRYLMEEPRDVLASPGRFRRNMAPTSAMEREARVQLEAVIETRPPDVRACFGTRRLFGLRRNSAFARAMRWFLEMNDTDAFGGRRAEPLFVVLFEWAAESVSEVDNRLEQLELLLRLIENRASELDAGVCVVRTWAESAMAGAPALLRRVLELLDAFRRNPQSVSQVT